VPSFFAVLQRFEEWRKSRKKPEAAPTGPAESGPPAAAERAATTGA
jgi:hypothetical protein